MKKGKKIWNVGNKIFLRFHVYFFVIALLTFFIPYAGALNLSRYGNLYYYSLYYIWIPYFAVLLAFYIIQTRDIPYKLVVKGGTVKIKTLYRTYVTKKEHVTLDGAMPVELRVLYRDGAILKVDSEIKKREFIVGYREIKDLLGNVQTVHA